MTVRRFIAAALLALVVACTSPKSIETRHAQMVDATVRVETKGGTGSATAISRRLFLTNHHVVEGQTDVTLRGWLTRNGRTFPVIYTGKVIAHDAVRDLALVELDDGTEWAGAVATLAPANVNLQESEVVMVSGAALGTRPHLTEGLVSLLRYVVPKHALLGVPHTITSATVVPGNSGGGLYAWRDAGWVLVGVPRAVAAIPSGFASTLVATHNYAIPIESVRQFLSEKGIKV